MKKIVKKGLDVLLALTLAGCLKTNQTLNVIKTKPTLNDYILTEEDIHKEYDTTILSDCYLFDVNLYYLEENNINKIVLVKNYLCIPPEHNSNDRYVISANDFFIISNGIKNGKKNIYDPMLCVENNAYVSVKELNDGKLIYFFDVDRDGKIDYALRDSYPDEETPRPVEKDSCPKFGKLI